MVINHIADSGSHKRRQCSSSYVDVRADGEKYLDYKRTLLEGRVEDEPTLEGAPTRSQTRQTRSPPDPDPSQTSPGSEPSRPRPCPAQEAQTLPDASQTRPRPDRSRTPSRPQAKPGPDQDQIENKEEPSATGPVLSSSRRRKSPALRGVEWIHIGRILRDPQGASIVIDIWLSPTYRSPAVAMTLFCVVCGLDKHGAARQFQ